MTPSSSRTRGFALATSLIFLVVVTLLALSAMRGVGLQEEMASNLREKSRALDAAETALHSAETTISNWAEPVEPGEADENGDVRVMGFEKPIDGGDQSFADEEVWDSDDAWVYDEPPYDGNDYGLVSPPKSYIEQNCFDVLIGGLDDNKTRRSDNPVLMTYRVTGHGTGGNVNAVAVVQSGYTWIYFDTDVVLTQTLPCHRRYASDLD